MTDFLITAPDGKKYKVSGADQAGAVAALKKMLGGTPTQEAPAQEAAAPAMSDREQRRARYEELRANAQPVSQDQRMLDATAEAAIRGKDGGALGSFAGNLAQGLTFGFADNIAAGIGSAVEGRSYDDILAGLRMQRQQDEQTNPKATIAGDIAGGVAGAGLAALTAGPTALAAAPTTLAGRTIAGVTAGGTAGAVEGALSGVGYADGQNTMDAAARGAVAGAAFGGVLGGAAPAISAGLRAGLEKLRGKDVRIIARTLNISDDAAKMIKPQIEAMDFDAAVAALRKAGPDAMLADAGMNTRRALDYAVTAGGKAARIGVDAVSDRSAKAGSRLNVIMDAVLGVPKGVKAVSRSIAARTAPARQKAYKAAYDTAINYADDTGRGIEEVLSRVDDETLTAAIKEANSAMRAEGIKNAQIMAIVDSRGGVKFREMPNTQQLDEIKKGLDAVARAETDELTGKISGKGLRAKKLAGELRTAIGEAVPAYRTAVRLGGDKIATETAMETGRKLFTPGMTRERVAEVMKDASVETKDAARQGIREYIDDTLARVRRSYDDPNVDTTETLKLLNTLSTRDAREKLVMVLGEGKADRLLKEIDAAGRQFGTRQAIAQGSQTAQRQGMDAQMKDILAPGVVGSAARGEMGGTFKSFMQMLTRATPEADMLKKQEVLADVARALTEMRGPQAEAALKLVQKATAGQPLKTAEAARIARLVTTTGALAGYQTGQKYIATPKGGTPR